MTVNNEPLFNINVSGKIFIFMLRSFLARRSSNVSNKSERAREIQVYYAIKDLLYESEDFPIHIVNLLPIGRRFWLNHASQIYVKIIVKKINDLKIKWK